MKERTNEAPVLTLTPATAVMSVAVMAAAADGSWSRREIERLRLMTVLQPLFRDVGSAEAFIGRSVADLRAVGPKSLLAASRAALTPRLRETAYAWAVDLVQADGAAAPKEHAFLQEVAAAFGVPGPLARKLQAAAAIRRRTA